MKMKFIVPFNSEKVCYVLKTFLRLQIKNSTAQNYNVTQKYSIHSDSDL